MEKIQGVLKGTKKGASDSFQFNLLVLSCVEFSDFDSDAFGISVLDVTFAYFSDGQFRQHDRYSISPIYLIKFYITESR